MFNLFKSNKTELKQNNTSTEPIVKKQYSKDILEIHNEFEIASEKLLNEAMAIINSQPIVNESKIAILKSLGFNQVKEVKESNEILSKTQMSKEQIELVRYYQQNYPFNKFINEKQVKEICHKYNLVCGDVNRFMGFVPEKNMEEIVNFKLKSNDVLKIICSKKTFGSNIGEIFKDKGERYYDFPNIYKLTEENSPLQICAPIKDMDISGLELKEGYKLEKKFIPDPIVLQPVKGGYLILTAWGDEASDPLVVNNNKN